MTDVKITVQFKFDGGLATQGVLDGSDHSESTVAVRRLLSLHVHTFLFGEVPHAARSQGEGYHVMHVGTREGCSYDEWQIWITTAAATAAVIKWYADTYRPEIKDATTACVVAARAFIADSLRAVLGIGARQVPEFQRVEPVLRAVSGNGEPLVDTDALADRRRGEFHERTRRALYDSARPVGRSAETLVISIDGQRVVEIDRQSKASLLELDITRAVRGLRGNPQAVAGTSSLF